MKRILLLVLLLVTSIVVADNQTNIKLTDSLLVSSSKFKLLATNVSYQGESCSPIEQVFLKSL